MRREARRLALVADVDVEVVEEVGACVESDADDEADIVD